MMDEWIPEHLKDSIASEDMPDMKFDLLGSVTSDDEREHGRISLMTMDTAKVSLECDEHNGARRVVFVDATAPEGQVLSASFDEFLLAWEQIAYLTPTRENLDPWLDSSGMLRPNASQARRLRSILAGDVG